MKRILVDAHCFDGEGQGIVSYIQGLYSELLNNKNYEITFACSNVEKIKKMFDVPINVIKIPKSNFLYRLGVFFPKILNQNKYDYAHFQYILPFFLSKKVKYITTIHDIIPIDFSNYYSLFYKLKVNILFRRAARKSDYVFTVSEYSRKRINCRFKVPMNKIFITCNAVKKSFSDNGNSQIEKENTILFVSRIEERKNHILLLKTFCEKEWSKNYKLVFIGTNSSNNKELYSYYNNLNPEVKEKVLFLSGLTDSELKEYYEKSAVFVYPSIAEGFGIPPLEAALLNLKVVCSNSTAMSDFDFFNKYSFNPNSIEELNNKLLSILVDDKYPYEEIKNVILERYTWKKARDVFDCVLNGGK